MPAPEDGPWPWLPVPRLPSPLSSGHGHLASKYQHERSLSPRACSPDARDARPSGAALDLQLRGMGCKWPGSPAAGVGWPWGRGSTLSSAPGGMALKPSSSHHGDQLTHTPSPAPFPVSLSHLVLASCTSQINRLHSSSCPRTYRESKSETETDRDREISS